MKYGPLFGWGIVIYAVSFLMATGLTIHPVPLPVRIAIMLVSLIVVSVAAGRSLGFRRSLDIVPYALVWALEVIGIDALITFQFTGWAMYANWQLWANYILIFCLPLLAPFTHRDHSDGLAH